MPPKSALVKRAAAWIILACLLGPALWLIAAIQFFYSPPQATPHRTDAIVVLGGLSRERLPVALELRDSLNIPILVISTTGTPGNVEGDAICSESDDDDVHLVCFRPAPLNTRGEATALGELIAEHGWQSITVVTSDYHVVRAGTLMGQCTTAEVQMVGSKPQLSPADWMQRFVVETGGLVDTWLRPECRLSR
ncbi:YdcF family protein [Paenarthrobacter sp. NPDC092416]|uniref:YdcF family protein n=1 Tax=Paenarthrobacter sp. NPDC092416 TaxID=3364386 RepID=UPI0037F15D59